MDIYQLLKLHPSVPRKTKKAKKDDWPQTSVLDLTLAEEELDIGEFTTSHPLISSSDAIVKNAQTSLFVPH